MSRPVAPKILTETALPITAPGYMIEVAFTSPVRMCSRGPVTFLGASFLEWGLDVSGLGSGVAQSGVNGTLTVRDPERVFQAYMLSEGIEDRLIRVWKFYGDVPAFDPVDVWSPVELFNGYAGGYQLNAGQGVISIDLSSSSTMGYSPRLRVTRENGFNWLPARNKIYEFGGERYKIEVE